MFTQPSQVVVRSCRDPAASDGPTNPPLEAKDRKRSRWGRVIAVKILSTRPKSFPWLENLITVVKAIRDSSSAVPLPYIQPAASIILNILEVVQSANRNEEDLKELATGLVGIIETIQTTLAAHCSGYDAPTCYLRQCDEFIRMLSEMSNDLNHIVHKHKSWTRFFRTTEIQDTITHWRRQIDDRRNNFTLMTVMNINLKLYTLPRELGYPWERSKPLRLVDAMNITIDLPLVLCSNQDDLHDLLSFLFRKRRGRHFVDQRHYNLTVGESDTTMTILTAAKWASLVKPGSNIDMNIVLRHDGLDDNDGRQCPTCRHSCTSASLGEEVTCPSCQTMFRVSRGIIEEVEEISQSPGRPLATSSPSASNPLRVLDSASSKSENLSKSSKGVQEHDNEALDIRYFRRFHVIMETHHRDKPPGSLPGEAVTAFGILRASTRSFEFAESDIYLHPLISHGVAMGHPCPLLWDLHQPPDSARRVGQSGQPITPFHLSRLATDPPTAILQITCDVFPGEWPIEVRSSEGVTVGDVLDSIRTTLMQPIRYQEWDQLTEKQRNRIAVQFEQRCNSAVDKDECRSRGVLRIDSLLRHTLFAGLSLSLVTSCSCILILRKSPMTNIIEL